MKHEFLHDFDRMPSAADLLLFPQNLFCSNLRCILNFSKIMLFQSIYCLFPKFWSRRCRCPDFSDSRRKILDNLFLISGNQSYNLISLYNLYYIIYYIHVWYKVLARLDRGVNYLNVLSRCASTSFPIFSTD